jgi:dienelactone hydrolase/TolA-binding protein
LFTSLVLAATVFAQAQSANEPISPGKVIEKVTCTKNPAQTYAVYLPTSYTPARTWPILYAFEPAARGPLSVNHFQEAAEKYGWIVVGSNNSKNGTMQGSLDAWVAMWDDTHQRFAIDARRVYVTGFSGGARVAIYFAKLCGDCIAGVIACGAGFPQGVTPSSDLKFVLFGAAGVDDFNFPELRNLDAALTRVGITHFIDSFTGRHEWPPATQTMVAVEWMEIQAIKSGRRARDEKILNDIWQEYFARAKTLEANGHQLEAYRTYLGLSESFAGLKDGKELNELASATKRLFETKEVKDALRDERRQIEKQHDLERQMSGLIAERQSLADAETDNRLQLLLARLRTTGKAEQDSGDRRVARRAMESVFAFLFENGIDQLQRKRYAEAEKSFETASDINPDRAGVRYYAAVAAALNGEKKKALQSLQKAVEKGFSDRDAIVNNAAFDSLRNEAVYSELLERLRKR